MKKEVLTFLYILVVCFSISLFVSHAIYTQPVPNPGERADRVWVSIGGVESTLQSAIDEGRIVILRDNRLGINTNNPQTDVDVNGTISAKFFCVNGDCRDTWIEKPKPLIFPSCPEGSILRVIGNEWQCSK